MAGSATVGPTGVAVRVDVWSDYVCPFCYLELPVLEQLKVELGRAVEIAWHPFELRPEPVPTLDPQGQYLRATWETSVYPLAQRRRVAMRLPPVQPRSRRAFEAACFARDAGAFDLMHHAIFQAFFEHGKDIGAVAALADIGRRVGLDADALQGALEEGRYTAEVVRELAAAQDIGVNAVPVLTARRADRALNEARALSGAVEYARVRDLVVSLQHP